MSATPRSSSLVRKRTARPDTLSKSTRDSLDRMILEHVREGLQHGPGEVFLPYACCDGNNCPFHKRLPQKRDAGVMVHTAVFDATTMKLLRCETVDPHGS